MNNHDLYDDITMSLIKLSGQVCSTLSKQFIQSDRLTVHQMRVLDLLKNVPDGLTMKEICQHLAIHKANLTFIIKKMEEKQLLERQRSDMDSRYSVVKLNTRGKKLLKKVSALSQSIKSEWFKEFSEHELYQFLAYLKRLSALTDTIQV